MLSDYCRDKNRLNTIYGKWMIVIITTCLVVEPSRLATILLSARTQILRIPGFEWYRIVSLANK